MDSNRYALLPGENVDLRAEIKALLHNADAWLHAPNYLLGGREPDQLIGTKEEIQVRNLVRAVKHGFIS
jgi:hypothetical protein